MRLGASAAVFNTRKIVSDRSSAVIGSAHWARSAAFVVKSVFRPRVLVPNLSLVRNFRTLQMLARDGTRVVDLGASDV